MSALQRIDTAGTLENLASQINAEHRACEAAAVSAVEHAIRAGEMLLEVKSGLKHGEWLPWLSANFEGTARTAQVYVQLHAKRGELSNTQRASHLSIRSALKELAAPGEAEAEDPQRETAEASARCHPLVMDRDMGRFLVEMDRPFRGEVKQQEDELLAGRWRPTLVVWRQEPVLLAGYNVYPFYVKHGIPFEVEEKDFASELDAIVWCSHRRILWALMLPFIASDENKRFYERTIGQRREHLERLESRARHMLELEGVTDLRSTALTKVIAGELVRELPAWGVEDMMVALGYAEADTGRAVGESGVREGGP